LLVAWVDTSPGVDAGVPSWAAEVVASALTVAHRLTFPSTTVLPGDAELCARLIVRGVWRRMTATGPSSFDLITTTRPEVVACAFDDPAFPWWMQAQFLLISPASGPAPQMSSEDVLSLIDAPETGEQLLQSRNLLGLLSPGVDGDVAALLTLEESVEHAFVSTLREAARKQGVSVQAVTEDELGIRLASSV
jgi:hypothetical protein